MICSSLGVPIVKTTIACVSPLVNNAEPWVLAKIPVSIVIGLISVVDLPSDLTFADNICSRKAVLSRESIIDLIIFSFSGKLSI